MDQDNENAPTNVDNSISPERNESPKEVSKLKQKRKSSAGLQSVTDDQTSNEVLSQITTTSNTNTTTTGVDSNPENEQEAERPEPEYDVIAAPRPAGKKKQKQGLSEEVKCLVANSSIILPVQWSGPTNAQSPKFINKLLNREIFDQTGAKFKLWEVSQKFPPEVMDLDAHFRVQLGVRKTVQVSKIQAEQADLIWRLQMTRDAMHLLFSNLKLEAKANTFTEQVIQEKSKQLLNPGIQKLTNASNTTATLPQDGVNSPQLLSSAAELNEAPRAISDEKVIIRCRPVFSRIILTVFPYGVALLQFNIDWLAKQSLTLDELRTWLSIAKTLRRIPGQFNGWNLCDTNYLDWRESLPMEHLSSLEERLCLSLYEQKPISLVNLARELLNVNTKNKINKNVRSQANNKKQKTSTPSVVILARSYHHSTVVVDKELNKHKLNEYFFHLRRAKGGFNQPPPQSTDSTELVLQPRKNRYIGICREGTVSFSWPITGSKNDFEIKNWPQQFHGIYRILALHVHGEKLVLEQLSSLSALTGSKLRWITGKGNFNEIKKGRKKLLSYMALVTQYTLQMQSDDCGGYTEYVQYFAASRKVHGVNKQRKELAGELREVSSIIEQNFNEEQQKMSKIDRLQKSLSNARKDRIGLAAGALSSIFLPLLLISGLFGMNNDDLPTKTAWGTLTWAASVAGVALILIFIVFYVLARKFDNEKIQTQTEAFLRGENAKSKSKSNLV